MTDYRASMPQYRPESFEKNRALFSLLEQLADEHHATASQISLAWMTNKRPRIPHKEVAYKTDSTMPYHGRLIDGRLLTERNGLNY